MTDADKEPDLKVNIEQTAHPDAYVVKIEIFGADIGSCAAHVCFCPKADITGPSNITV
jgi:hypothetical protein